METLSPSVVLAAYAEPLLDGRRVAVFGDATSSIADELLERGARVVHLYDPNTARAAEAATRNRSKQISVLPLDTADIAVRDGAFDVALIADLSDIREPAQLLKRVRRALAPRGTAIIATPNPDAKLALVPRAAVGRSSALSYYDLFDAVSAEFSEVRMLGQTPFVGYAVVDFSPEGEPEVSLDSGLVPGGAEEPEWFVAMASSSPVEIDAFSIVQLPMARVVRGAGVDPKIVDEIRALEEELSTKGARLSELEARAVAADVRSNDAKTELEALREKTQGGASLDAARADLDRRAREQQGDKERLEKRALEHAGEKERLEKRIAEHAGEKERLEKRIAEHAGEKERLEKRALEQAGEKERLEKRLLAEHAVDKERLEKRIAEHIAEKERLDERLAQRDQELERLVTASAGEDPDDVARLEAALKDRGERIRKLESDLREAERIGKELVWELSRGRAPAASEPRPAEPPGTPQLSTENARLRADLEAAGWTIQELEGRLSPPPPR